MLKRKIGIPLEKLYPILIFNFVTNQMPTKETYEDRLLWQKVGYLAQQLGAGLNEYCFNWYKAGPYSPSYTSLLYSLPEYLEVVSDYNLNDHIQDKLKPLKVIFYKKPEILSTPKWFELIASILFIKKETGFDKEAVLKRLVRKKPFFDDHKINNSAWDLLKKLDMI